jgi:hypothetical protein
MNKGAWGVPVENVQAKCYIDKAGIEKISTGSA